MSLDLVEKFSELSVSSLSKPVFLNKKPLNVCYSFEEYLIFESFKYSSRILLNYKDMAFMGLKAGSLLRIYHKGIVYFVFVFNIDSFLETLISNVFEVWPSIMIKPNGI